VKSYGIINGCNYKRNKKKKRDIRSFDRLLSYTSSNVNQNGGGKKKGGGEGKTSEMTSVILVLHE